MGLLIVDDDPDLRLTLRVLLESCGYTDVWTVGSARDAMDRLTSPTPIDLILTDVTMPGLSGIDLCRLVKDTPTLHDIPVLIVTGRADEDVLERAFAAGAHDFLPKGVSPIELLARVRSALNLKRELDERKARERELVALNRRLERLGGTLRRVSLLDDLTGVPNRRSFNRTLRQEWGRAAREVHPLALVMMDVDQFKAFNDRYGHPAGDACLSRVASLLTGLIRRPGDSLARYGDS